MANLKKAFINPILMCHFSALFRYTEKAQETHSPPFAPFRTAF